MKPVPAATPGADLLRDLQQGLALHHQGRLAEAERVYRNVLSVKRDQFDALHLLGVVRLQQGRAAEGVEFVEAALKVNPNAADALGNLGNGLRELGRYQDSLVVFERLLAIGSREAAAHNGRGLALLGLNRYQDALASLDQAIAIDPDHAEAHHNRGVALMHLHRPDDAAADFDRALALNPRYLSALNNQGVALHKLERYEGAVASFAAALAIRPDYVEALCNCGNVLTRINRLDEAISCFEKLFEIDPGHVEGHWNDSLARLCRGDFRDGWREYEWRWAWKEFRSPRRDFLEPLWLGEESLEGRTILLHAEQGLGDTIQFVRYAPLVASRGARVALEVQPPLLKLLAGVEGVSEIVGQGEDLPVFDRHCPLMSLPLVFGTELGNIPANVPYLRAPTDCMAKWRSRLGDKGVPCVGMAWAGSAGHPNDRHRSIALGQFSALFAQAGVQFVSLQKGLAPSDAAVLQDFPHVLGIGEEFQDFADTAAVISMLDLVISVDTSIVHLAGAMGRPVWNLVAFAPDFRWMLDREDSPWYPTMRLFRQSRIGEWDDVLHRVRAELARYAG